LNTLVKLTESDFEYETENGEVIPVIDLGEDSEFIVTYGHVDPEEMECWVNDLHTSFGIPTEEYTINDISWHWAVALETADASLGFELRWKNVREDDNGAFPVTIAYIW